MPERRLESSRILIIDDNVTNTLLLHELLSLTGYRNIAVENDSTQAVEMILRNRFDLVILDLHMPNVTGFDIMRQLLDQMPPDSFLPILAFTADWTESTRKRALELGAWDFITKPFDATELLLRVRNFLRMREMHVALEEQNRNLEAVVERRTRHVIRARTEALDCLARAGEFRDDATGEHAKRVGKLSAAIARALGLSESSIDLIETAAPLHDLGKIGVPDSILLKPGKLTHEEIELMRHHAGIGGRIIGRVKSPQLRKAREIALYHHEAWDGSGYPHGMSGSAIPIAARIVAIADTYDALTHERPYKPAWSIADAIREIENHRGRRFDPEVVDAFLSVVCPASAVTESEPAEIRPEIQSTEPETAPRN